MQAPCSLGMHCMVRFGLSLSSCCTSSPHVTNASPSSLEWTLAQQQRVYKPVPSIPGLHPAAQKPVDNAGSCTGSAVCKLLGGKKASEE